VFWFKVKVVLSSCIYPSITWREIEQKDRGVAASDGSADDEVLEMKGRQRKEYCDLAKVCGLYYIFIVSVALNREKNIVIWQRCVVCITFLLSLLH
jgi:hypothetical protein